MGNYRMPLDAHDVYPEAMTTYVSFNGWHFNKKLCDWAVARMKKYDESTGKPEKIEPWKKDDVDKLLKDNAVRLENNTGYDYVYVANMAKADLLESSLPGTREVARYVKDIVDDVDQADGFIMNRFYSDCVRSGCPIPWDDVL